MSWSQNPELHPKDPAPEELKVIGLNEKGLM
jgi:hypothetical protein